MKYVDYTLFGDKKAATIAFLKTFCSTCIPDIKIILHGHSVRLTQEIFNGLMNQILTIIDYAFKQAEQKGFKSNIVRIEMSIVGKKFRSLEFRARPLDKQGLYIFPKNNCISIRTPVNPKAKQRKGCTQRTVLGGHGSASDTSMN